MRALIVERNRTHWGIKEGEKEGFSIAWSAVEGRKEGRGNSHRHDPVGESLKQPRSKTLLVQANSKCFQVYTGDIAQLG